MIGRTIAALTSSADGSRSATTVTRIVVFLILAPLLALYLAEVFWQ